MINDEEKDEFIKEKFSKDILISKKADELFNSYIDGKMSKDNIVHINEIKEKDSKLNNKLGKRKKIMASVAALVVVFLGVNGYAYTKGYNNIFFLIRKIVSQDPDISYGKNEILTDTDLTISYEPIDIEEGITIQINKLVVVNNKATIEMKALVDKDSQGFDKISIKDITNGEGKTIANMKYENSGKEGFDPIIVELNGFNDSMKILKMEINRGTDTIAELKINLEEKTIDVLSSHKSTEMEKLSEVELKKTLSELVRINYWRDNGIVISRDENVDAVNEGILETAESILYKKNQSNMSSEIVKTFYKEITGMDIENVQKLISTYSVYVYNKGEDSIESIVGLKKVNPYVINIEDINYSKGFYDVTYTYCYMRDGEGAEDEIDSLPVYRTSMRLRLNKGYKYSMFQIDGIYDIGSDKVKEASDSSNDGNTTNNTNNANSTNNTVSHANHEHKMEVVKRTGNEEYHTTLDGTHVVKCSICGETKTEPHNFGTWYTLYDGTAWSLWCKDCQRYVFTTDYNFVQHSGYDYTPNETHEHKMEVVKRAENEDYHTTLDGTHMVKCATCGETKTEPHNFGTWYTLYDGTAWSLWCKDCQRYVFTTDFNVVKNSGYAYEDKAANTAQNN